MGELAEQVSDQTAPGPAVGEPGLTTQPDKGGPASNIRCPLCRWTPARTDQWMCTCKHHWNTFETRGLCPACFLQWTYTMCPRCGVLSLHADWYVPK
jgi:hypothetical protein